MSNYITAPWNLVAFIFFALLGLIWLNLRQPETLPISERKKLKANEYFDAFKLVITNASVVKYTLTLALGFGALFGYLNSAQQIFVDTFSAGMKFPLYFAIISILAAPASFINASLVILTFSISSSTILRADFLIIFLRLFSRLLTPASLA